MKTRVINTQNETKEHLKRRTYLKKFVPYRIRQGTRDQRGSTTEPPTPFFPATSSQITAKRIPAKKKKGKKIAKKKPDTPSTD